jgi:hypothetical protein
VITAARSMAGTALCTSLGADSRGGVCAGEY